MDIIKTIAGAAGRQARGYAMDENRSEGDEKSIEVVRDLEEDIIFGRLAPGTRLVEDVLMERFDATRHSVRMALSVLARRGIVVKERNKGAAVRALTPDQVLQVYEVREMLHRNAALLIPLPADPAFLAELEAIQAEHRAAVFEGNVRKVHETNDRFHVAMFSGCGNSYLVDSIIHYMNLTLGVRVSRLDEEVGENTTWKEHDIMISLMRGRDRWALSELCVSHLQASKFHYLSKVGR